MSDPQEISGHERFEELVAGAALHALEPYEEAELAQHLAVCSFCREALAELDEVAAQLAWAAPLVDLPEGLLPALQAAMRQAEQPPAPVSASARPPVPPAGPARRGGERRRPSGRRGERSGPARGSGLGQLRSSLRLVAATAAAVVVLAVGFTALRVHQTMQQSSVALARYETIVNQLQQPGTRLVSLGRQGAASGTAVLHGRRLWLVVDHLGRNNTQSSIYVLWARRRDGQMVAVTGFDVTSPGMTLVAATLPAAVHNPNGFAISQEPGRTIPAAPSTPVLGPATAVG